MTHLSSSTLTKLGEFGLISRISAGVCTHESVITGIGDDAAVTELSSGMQMLTSTDMLLEDVHFRRCWHDPYSLGRKSLAASISDIAAMGGFPRWALLSLALPSDLPLDFIDDFMRGFLAMASENQVVLIGGDTCSSRSALVVSVTVMGEQLPERIVRRSGAMPGDDIWVTGTLGDAAIGLESLENGKTVSDELILRLLDPTPRVSAALALAEAGLATAMIDVSDGLMADYGHIAEQSGVGGRILIADLPLSDSFQRYTADLPILPCHFALSGGEDYELCFTANSSDREKIIDCIKKCGIEVARVGIVTSCSGVTAVHRDGSLYIAQADGFNHFK
ncbi:MAG: thiamine-phosphate kinase [Geobacteraceae bacterium]|nr:thiamine-phosphate kinase [Geobacteraceae bacterium]NTW81103.1 thiamine-phosphate kinase [Geobacteraceae bacterium]